MAQDRWGTSPLFLASQTGNPDLINALLTASADVGVRDVNDRTPLYQASSGGTPANIKAFLTAGANIMAADQDGETPLHSAAVGGAPATIKALLIAGTEGYWALNDAQYNQINQYCAY